MKIQQVKTFLKKCSIITISFALTANITACSFQFNKEDIKKAANVVKEKTQIAVEGSASSEFTQKVIEDVKNVDWEAVKEDADAKGEEVKKELDKLSKDLTKAAQEYADKQQLGLFQKATVVRVVDGDTIVVDIEGQQAKVRLIGIDTPESVASQEYLDRTGKENTQEGKDASSYTKEFLTDYPEVYLEKDVSETDKYGRLLRYVWVEVPEEIDTDQIRTKMLNGILLDAGIANLATYPPDVKYVDQLKEINADKYESSEYEAE